MAPLRRIGLLGDIHAEDASLAMALRVLADAGVDAVAAVGDIADGPGERRSLLRAARSCGRARGAGKP